MAIQYVAMSRGKCQCSQLSQFAHISLQRIPTRPTPRVQPAIPSDPGWRSGTSAPRAQRHFRCFALRCRFLKTEVLGCSAKPAILQKLASSAPNAWVQRDIYKLLVVRYMQKLPFLAHTSRHQSSPANPRHQHLPTRRKGLALEAALGSCYFISLPCDWTNTYVPVIARLGGQSPPKSKVCGRIKRCAVAGPDI